METSETINDKQRKILSTAEKIFANKGFEAASVREIAKQAGVNLAMISYYFGSKEKMFETIFKLRMEAGQSYVREIAEDKSVDEAGRLFHIIDNYVNKVKHNQSFYRILLAVQVTTKNKRILSLLRNTRRNYYEFYKALIQAGYRKKIFTRKADPLFVHAFVNGTIYYSLQSKELSKEFLNNQQPMADFDEDYFNGLANQLKQTIKEILGYNEA